MNGSSSKRKFLVRVRHSKGCARIELPRQSQTTIEELKVMIEEKLSFYPSLLQDITLHGKSEDRSLANKETLQSLDVEHGHMFYLTMKSRKRKRREISVDSDDEKNAPAMNGDTSNDNVPRPRGHKRHRNNGHIVTNLDLTAESDTDMGNRVENGHSLPRNDSEGDVEMKTRETTSSNGVQSHSSSSTTHTNMQSNGPNIVTLNSGSHNTPPRARGVPVPTTASSSNPGSNSNSNSRSPRKKKGKGKKKKEKEALLIESEGDTEEEIAQNYLHNNMASETQEIDAKKKKEMIGLTCHLELISTQRVNAIKSKKYCINEVLKESRFTSMAKSRGTRYLFVTYTGGHKKQRAEQVRYYDNDTFMENILYFIVRRHFCGNDSLPFSNGSTSVSGKESNGNRNGLRRSPRRRSQVLNKKVEEIVHDLCKSEGILSLKEMAKRSPCLLWSITHSFPENDMQEALIAMVKKGVKRVRREMKANAKN